ncbi:hypothetical protein ES703_83267 [subsurface metagenome]
MPLYEINRSVGYAVGEVFTRRVEMTLLVVPLELNIKAPAGRRKLGAFAKMPLAEMPTDISGGLQCLSDGQYTPRHGVYTVGSPERGKALVKITPWSASSSILGVS